MRRIDPADLTIRPFHILDREWALLASGAARPNLMTVSWGGLGTLWERPMVTVYVRPTRYTFSLLAERPEFTLNFMPPAARPALQLCGTRSGRDLDKWKAAGLTAEPSETIAVPRVAGARLALECRVVASLDFDPQRFLDAKIEKLYPNRDYHRVMFGELLAAWEAEDA